MSEGDGKFPCSICDAAFSNPRDLGTHILTDHCDQENEDDDLREKSSKKRKLSIEDEPSSPFLFNNNNGGTNSIIEAHLDPHKSIIMAVDPLEHGDITIEPVTSSAGTVSLANLPRDPTPDEQKQKFMIHSLSPAPSASPSSPDHSSSRYICLVCGKAYTSRYNIRCHLNMHTGKNVHSCPYCNRFFAHKHVFDSHLRTHTGERPFSCSRCGRAFSDRSNCSSHQKKCRGSDSGNKKIGLQTPENNGTFSETNTQQQLLSFNTQITSNTNPGNDKNIVNTEKEKSAIEEELKKTTIKFEPQIVSVKSMSELCDPKASIHATSVFESTLNAFIKDEEEDDDLEEIQIEPDITDYDSQRTQQDKVPHISLPCVPLPRQTLAPVRTTITPANIRPKPAMTLIVPVPLTQQQQQPQQQQQQLHQVPPPPSSVYTCSFCNVRFSEQSVLITHLSDHVQIPSNPTSQDIDRGYMTFSAVGGQRTKSMCLSCGKTFNKEPQVKIHLNVHNGDNIYNCRFCEKIFANYSGFEEHVKTHAEEYKFSCKYCNSAFMNRNVMVSHQKNCHLNTEASGATISLPPVLIQQPQLPQTPSAVGGIIQPPAAEKRFKVVLNSDEIKNLIRAKDEEIRKQEEANRVARSAAEKAAADKNILAGTIPMVSIPTNVLAESNVSDDPDIKHEPMSDDSFDEDEDLAEDDANNDNDDDYDEGVDPLEASLKPIVKPVVRKRAPVFPFEPEDHYVPDNNSNNVINKKEITPPPTAAERAQGYCLRPFRNGQQRYICIVCGKHYTTTYNMRQHRNIHTGRGLHCCRYCGRDFTHKHVWETHERIHTGERPFRCPTCPKDFADRSNYNSHRKLCAMNAKQASPGSTQALNTKI